MKQYEAPERKLFRNGLWSNRVGFCEYKNKYTKRKKKKGKIPIAKRYEALNTFTVLQ